MLLYIYIMYTTTTWRIPMFCSFPNDLRIYHLIKVMMVMMKPILLYYSSYFQVIGRLSQFFLMTISYVWYTFSDERMKVLRRVLVLSPRSHKKITKSVCQHWVSMLFPLYHGVVEFFFKAGDTTVKCNMFLVMLRVESTCMN